MNSTIRAFLSVAVVSIAGAALSGCVNFPDPFAVAGKAAGAALGAKIAEATPVPTTTVVKPRGGAFCPVVDGIGRGIGEKNGAPPLGPDDQLSPVMSDWVASIGEHGEKHCGWEAPNP